MLNDVTRKLNLVKARDFMHNMCATVWKFDHLFGFRFFSTRNHVSVSISVKKYINLFAWREGINLFDWREGFHPTLSGGNC